MNWIAKRLIGKMKKGRNVFIISIAIIAVLIIIFQFVKIENLKDDLNKSNEKIVTFENVETRLVFAHDKKSYIVGDTVRVVAIPIAFVNASKRRTYDILELSTKKGVLIDYRMEDDYGYFSYDTGELELDFEGNVQLNISAFCKLHDLSGKVVEIEDKLVLEIANE